MFRSLADPGMPSLCFQHMLIIDISWEYFLGILDSLMVLACYTNGRLTRLETHFDWLADAVRDLTIRLENASAKAFQTAALISFTAIGEQLLRDSGFKSHIDRHRDELSAQRVSAPLYPYAIGSSAFRLLDRIPLDNGFARQRNKFSLRNGTNPELLRRLGHLLTRNDRRAELPMKIPIRKLITKGVLLCPVAKLVLLLDTYVD